MPSLAPLRSFALAALNLLYPPRCAACLARLPAPGDFCPPCTAQLQPIDGPHCRTCSEPFSGRLTAPFACPNCRGQSFAFDCALSAWQSSGPLREAIHRFKYGRHLHLRLPLAHKLRDTLADPRFPLAPAANWFLVPVPLHPRRFRERRFNQSAELALALSKLTGLPCLNLLRRTRYTSSQAALNRQERLRNLAGAFALKPRTPLPPHAGFLLVDDVFTTGSTAHECAAALKQAGAGPVIVLTVARG